MRVSGGFVSFVESSCEGVFEGSLVVFKDPLYRSYGREGVGCFGLVTAQDPAVLEAMLDVAAQELASRGFMTMRGPVNAPRSLFGYGVQTSDHDLPVVAGSSSDPPAYAHMFEELYSRGYFNSRDGYCNLVQDFDKTGEYISTLKLDRNFRVINPDFNDVGDLPEKIADLMNRTLGYRPDYLRATAGSLVAAMEMYKLVPGSECLIGLFYDGETLAGAVLMQPDWFQVLARMPIKTIVGDIYMLDKPYQGRRLFMNFSEYSIAVVKGWGASHYEHASMWEHMEAIKSSIKNGYAKAIKEYWVFEKQY